MGGNYGQVCLSGRAKTAHPQLGQRGFRSTGREAITGEVPPGRDGPDIPLIRSSSTEALSARGLTESCSTGLPSCCAVYVSMGPPMSRPHAREVKGKWETVKRTGSGIS
jgi:hypothetical protein